VETNNNTQTTNHNNVVFKSANNGGATLYYTVSTSADQSVVSSSTVDGVSGAIKPEFVDYSILPPEIEDIAAIIGSAIADTTVPNVDGLVGPGEDAAASRDSWMDLDAWIDTACGENNVQNGNSGGKTMSTDSINEFVVSTQFNVGDDSGNTSSTLQSLLTHGLQQQQAFSQQAAMLLKRETSTSFQQTNHMPLLQNRLQNGPPALPNGAIKPESSSYLSECPSPSSSTSYLNSKDMMLPHTTTGSPPGHVVSTTDNTIILNGTRYQSIQQRNRQGYGHIRGLKTVPSPDLLVNGSSLDSLVHGNYPHTTAATTTTPSPSKVKNRSRSSRKQHSGGGCGGSVYSTDGGGGILGKEKPVHRCTICNRGFLNKSNIKVHLRTHTGEKPFRCEVCGKAFRQKAHLIKHQQIHKRVGRD
jgi:Zinc finger, C2H2 type.